MTTPGFRAHDHADCIDHALEAARRICAAEKLKLTPIRERVLAILLTEHRAMGAYDVLDVLRREAHAAQPPVAYRALDFLVTHRFAHRVEKLNAFIACAMPGEDHRPAFLICRACRRVAEAGLEPGGALCRAAAGEGFSIDTMVVEAVGLCPACSEAKAPCA